MTLRSFFLSRDFADNLRTCLTTKELRKKIDSQLADAGLLPPNEQDFIELCHEMFRISALLLDEDRQASLTEEAFFLAVWRFSDFNIWAERLVISTMSTCKTDLCIKIMTNFVEYDLVMRPLAEYELIDLEDGELPN
jgi:hypothetical protein